MAYLLRALCRIQDWAADAVGHKYRDHRGDNEHKGDSVIHNTVKLAQEPTLGTVIEGQTGKAHLAHPHTVNNDLPAADD